MLMASTATSRLGYHTGPLKHVRIHSGGAIKTVRRPCLTRAADFRSDFYEISQQLDALRAKLEGASAAPSKASTKTTENSLGYVCDENGCVLLDQSSSASTQGDGELELTHELSSTDWMIGVGGDCSVSGYCGVLGGKDWNVSLTQNELNDFVTALKAIREAIIKLTEHEPCNLPDTGAGRAVQVKWDTKTVKMEATCTTAGKCKDNFNLSFMIGVGGLRLVRAAWSSTVVGEVLEALDLHLPGFALRPEVDNNGKAATPAASNVPVAAGW